MERKGYGAGIQSSEEKQERRQEAALVQAVKHLVESLDMQLTTRHGLSCITGQIHKNDILPLTKQAWVTCMVESWFSKFLALSLDVSLTLVIVQNMMLPGIDYFLQVHFPLCVYCIHDNHTDGDR